MKITTIIGEQGKLPQLCKNGACPAAIITDGESAFVQGYLLAETEQAELTAPAGEGFVRIPLAALKKIAAQVTHL